jgi:hypothetical protein
LKRLNLWFRCRFWAEPTIARVPGFASYGWVVVSTWSLLTYNGDERDRTANLLVANQALSQLSYVPRLGGRRPGDRLGSPNVNFMIATAGWFG